MVPSQATKELVSALTFKEDREDAGEYADQAQQLQPLPVVNASPRLCPPAKRVHSLGTKSDP